MAAPNACLAPWNSHIRSSLFSQKTLVRFSNKSSAPTHAGWIVLFPRRSSKLVPPYSPRNKYKPLDHICHRIYQKHRKTSYSPLVKGSLWQQQHCEVTEASERGCRETKYFSDSNQPAQSIRQPASKTWRLIGWVVVCFLKFEKKHVHVLFALALSLPLCLVEGQVHLGEVPTRAIPRRSNAAGPFSEGLAKELLLVKTVAWWGL